jgi:hypothetical protein
MMVANYTAGNPKYKDGEEKIADILVRCGKFKEELEELVDEVLLLGQLGQQRLQDDWPLEARYAALHRVEDLAHTADGEPMLNLVLAKDQVGHRFTRFRRSG